MGKVVGAGVGSVVALLGGDAPLAGDRAAVRENANDLLGVAGEVLNVASTPRPASVARMTGVMRFTVLRSELEAFEVDVTTRDAESFEPASYGVDERGGSADEAILRCDPRNAGA